MRHMSAQLVPDLPEERDSVLPFLLPLDALRPLAVHHAGKEVVACAFGPDPDGPPGTVRILKLERPVTFSGNPWAFLA